MVARHWRGVAVAARSDEYLAHLRIETFPKLHSIPGFQRAQVLTRHLSFGVEFLVITEWESEDAIRAFAGEDVEAAVVPPLVQSLMIFFDRHAQHYDVQHQT